ncbi:hypothetical protein BC830DRAFT_131065 [Chytriomyces sp. MP71]|nr:hypothetical protein BC830DRAFT_131065 [Chytriomyces sp. MP71]
MRFAQTSRAPKLGFTQDFAHQRIKAEVWSTLFVSATCAKSESTCFVFCCWIECNPEARHMADDSIPWIWWTRIIVFCIGLLLNTSIVVATAIRFQTAITATVNKITTALVVCCFVWCIERCYNLIHRKIYNLPKTTFEAAFGTSILLLLFALNVNLAMERYGAVVSMTTTRAYIALYSIYVALLLINVGLFVTTGTVNYISPTSQPQKIIWLSIMSAAWLSTAIFTCWCYYKIYTVASRAFDDRPGFIKFFLKTRQENLAQRGSAEDLVGGVDPNEVELVRQKMERQVLLKCILLSFTIILCYAPTIAFEICKATPNWNNPYDSIASVFVGLDTLVTPILILAFSPNLRRTLLFFPFVTQYNSRTA